MPILSIVILCYKQIELVNKLVDKLKKYNDVEIIVINEISGLDYEYSSNDVKFKNVSFLNISKSRNVGINMSTGKFISVLDGDDDLNTDKFDELLNKLDNLSSDVIFLPCKNQYTCGKYEILISNNVESMIEYDRDFLIKEYVSRKYGQSHHRYIFNREFVLKNNIYYDETIPNLIEDYDYTSMLIDNLNTCSYIQDIGHYYVYKLSELSISKVSHIVEDNLLNRLLYLNKTYDKLKNQILKDKCIHKINSVNKEINRYFCGGM